MKQLKIYVFLLFLFLLAAGIGIPRIRYLSETSRLTEDTVPSADFRSQPLPDAGSAELSEVMDILRSADSPGELLGIWWLESDFGREETGKTLEEGSPDRKRWETNPAWSGYLSSCRAVWDDLKCFPVVQGERAGNSKAPGGTETEDGGSLNVTFEDSWMYGRSYKGERGHEGTDLMPEKNERGYYPIVSMTDGTVESMGWLELGGWRIGIRAPQGGYFYYAHLDSYADLEVGDSVKAGELLGYMGDTGYSKVEGTTGNFPVHLHLGIYINYEGEEISVNPYPALKFVEGKQISMVYK